MTRDDIIRMAIKCQLVTTSNRDGIYADALQRFAALVAAEKDKEIERLREALQAALDGGCSYVHANEDDEIGRHGCCDALSYKPHEPDCWTLKAEAALRREDQ